MMVVKLVSGAGFSRDGFVFYATFSEVSLAPVVSWRRQLCF